MFKAEFPLDVSAVKDEAAWLHACKELTAASQIPWILLSGSSDYETFLRQVTAACQAGASGVAVGRAVWREAPGLPESERQGFLTNVALERMRRITELVDAVATPWRDYFQPVEVSAEWFME